MSENNQSLGAKRGPAAAPPTPASVGAAAVERVREQLSAILDDIADLFVAPPRLQLVIRPAGLDDHSADIVIGNDTLSGTIGVLEYFQTKTGAP